MTKIEESILSYIKRHGPSTSLDVARGVEENSLIVSALLVDAESQRKLAKSRRKVGSMRLYYLPEQKQDVEKKVAAMLTEYDKKLLQKIMDYKAVCEGEIEANDKIAFESLEDLLGTFVLEYQSHRMKCWRSPNIPEEKARELILNRIGPVKPVEEPKPEVTVEVKEEPKPEIREEIKPTVEEVKPAPKEVGKEVEKPKRKKKEKQKKLIEEPAEKTEFMNFVDSWMETSDIEVLKSGVDHNEIRELKVKMKTPVGKQDYTVKILEHKKKKASQGDISALGMEAVSKRTPMLIISKTGFAKSALKYWKKELQDLVTLMSKEDME